jgi:hypothetical protein
VALETNRPVMALRATVPGERETVRGERAMTEPSLPVLCRALPGWDRVDARSVVPVRQIPPK